MKISISWCSQGSDDLENTFQSRLQAIGEVLVLFDDWSKPAYLTLWHFN